MKFPNWAPELLIAEHEWLERTLPKLRHSGISRVTELKMLSQMITNPNMESAWKEIEQQLLEKHGKLDGSYLGMIARSAGTIAVKSKKPFSTKTEEKSKFEEIANKSQELSKLLSATPLDSVPFRWFSDEAIDSFDNDCAPGVAACMRTDKKRLLNTPKNAYDPPIPMMSELLLAMASEARSIKKSLQSSKPILEKAIDRKSAPRRYFVRTMAEMFRYWFGSSLSGAGLRNTIASFASTLLDEDCDAEKVKDDLRYYTISEKGRRWAIVEDGIAYINIRKGNLL